MKKVLLFTMLITTALLLYACAAQQKSEASAEYYQDTVIENLETFTSVTGVALNIKEENPESQSISYNYLMDNNAEGLGNVLKYEGYLKEFGFTKNDSLSTDTYTTYQKDGYVVITGSFNPQPNVIQYIVNVSSIDFNQLAKEDTEPEPSNPTTSTEDPYEEAYKKIVSLVEDKKYSEARDYYMDNANYSFFHYKDTGDYYHYAEAMAYYTDPQFRPLAQALEILKSDVTEGFLDSDSIISEIEASLSQIDGIYQQKRSGNYQYDAFYLIIDNGEVEIENGKKSDIPTGASHFTYTLAAVTLDNGDEYYAIAAGKYSDSKVIGLDRCKWILVDFDGEKTTLVSFDGHEESYEKELKKMYAGTYTRVK